jgi:hypothetical protein
MKENANELWERFCRLYTELQLKNIKRMQEKKPVITKTFSDISRSMSTSSMYSGYLRNAAKRSEEHEEVVANIKLITKSSFFLS